MGKKKDPMVIPIRLETSHVEMRYTWDDLREFQEDEDFALKDLTFSGWQKLEKSFKRHGFIKPVFIWKGGDGKLDEKPYLLDGHQRKRFFSMGNPPYTLEGGVVPSVEIKADTFQEASEIVLRMDSQHGVRTSQGLYKYVEKWKLPVDDLAELDLPDIDVGAFKKEFYDEILEDLDDEPLSFDEVEPDSIETTHTCPECGFEWSGKSQ